MTRSALAAALLALVALPQMARASLSMRLDEYQHQMQQDHTRGQAQAYVEAVARGLVWANTRIRQKHGSRATPMFCTQGRVEWNGPEIRAMVDQEIARGATTSRPYVGSDPLELVMIMALEARFPCD